MKQLEDMTDAELSEAFALEVAGLKLVEDHPGTWIWMDGKREYDESVDFATSADAVLPFLEKHTDCLIDLARGGVEWEVCVYTQDGREPGVDKSFARAACIALIKAKRNAT